MKHTKRKCRRNTALEQQLNRSGSGGNGMGGGGGECGVCVCVCVVWGGGVLKPGVTSAQLRPEFSNTQLSVVFPKLDRYHYENTPIPIY